MKGELDKITSFANKLSNDPTIKKLASNSFLSKMLGFPEKKEV